MRVTRLIGVAPVLWAEFGRAVARTVTGLALLIAIGVGWIRNHLPPPRPGRFLWLRVIEAVP